ncbi:MAG: L-histidine N(alpha)-methyltransferase [Bdellovibrionota bacterium]
MSCLFFFAFSAICEAPEYYVTRTESEILRRSAPELRQLAGRAPLLLEYGSGAATKTRILLDALHGLDVRYVAIDISDAALMSATSALSKDYPDFEVFPVVGDFTRPWCVPKSILARLSEKRDRKIVFFPGSTIGNFHPGEALSMLRSIGDLLGEGGILVIGIDLAKAAEILEAAYNDRGGATAAFNLNCLARMNRELGTDFDLSGFEHRARFNAFHSRIEMHLVARTGQRVSLPGGQFIEIAEGESIHTENSYKYSSERFESLADRAGFATIRRWTDDRKLFGVFALSARTLNEEYRENRVSSSG